MKLIYCPHCEDIRKLSHQMAHCHCGRSFGQYEDRGLNAIYGGDAVPLGFANSSFVDALRNQPEGGMGRCFEAFVIPKQCPTFKQVAAPERESGPYATKAHLRHPAPDEEVTFGGAIQKTGIKRGPAKGIQPKR